MLLTISILLSFLVGTGFNTIFSFIARYKSAHNKSVLFCLCFLLVRDFMTGVLAFTVVNYLVIFLCFKLSVFLGRREMKTYSVATLLCFTYYFLSNSVCFFQMLGFYQPSFLGYLTCLQAGIPFLLRSLFATFFAEGFIKLFSSYHTPARVVCLA